MTLVCLAQPRSVELLGFSPGPTVATNESEEFVKPKRASVGLGISRQDL